MGLVKCKCISYLILQAWNSRRKMPLAAHNNAHSSRSEPHSDSLICLTDRQQDTIPPDWNSPRSPPSCADPQSDSVRATSMNACLPDTICSRNLGKTVQRKLYILRTYDNAFHSQRSDRAPCIAVWFRFSVSFLEHGCC